MLGLLVLALLFSQVSDQFLSAFNLGNIPGQGAYIAVIAMGLVFVLLLGEIDLSAGTAGGACAAFAAVGVFKGSLHDGLPGALYWSIVVGPGAADRVGDLGKDVLPARWSSPSAWCWSSPTRRSTWCRR